MTETHTTSTLTAADIDKAVAAIKENSQRFMENAATTKTSRNPGMRGKMTPELHWIESQLMLGFYMVLPERIHAMSVEQLRAVGFYEEAIERIFASRYLPAKSDSSVSDGFLIKETI